MKMPCSLTLPIRYGLLTSVAALVFGVSAVYAGNWRYEDGFRADDQRSYDSFDPRRIWRWSEIAMEEVQR